MRGLFACRPDLGLVLAVRESLDGVGEGRLEASDFLLLLAQDFAEFLDEKLLVGDLGLDLDQTFFRLHSRRNRPRAAEMSSVPASGALRLPSVDAIVYADRRGGGEMRDEPKKPRYDLDTYRKFIREATPYVSIVAGRRLRPDDADRMSEQELTRLALLLDERADALKPKPH